MRCSDRSFCNSSFRNSSFDLVTCFADSLNYLIADGDLDRVFAGAAAALVSGGHLICDLNSQAEYNTWDERDIVTLRRPGLPGL